MDRPETTPQNVNASNKEVYQKWMERLQTKGPHIFASSHEILGVVTEEFYELIDAVKSNDIDNVEKELVDIAVARLQGLASIKSNEMDW